MKIKIKMIISVLFIVTVSLVLADSPPEKKGINYLEREISFVEDSSRLSLLPGISKANGIQSDLEKFKPSGVVELSYKMPLPDVPEDELMLHILQSISQISSLEGIKYYSGSRKKMYLYLEKAYLVEKRRNLKALDDPVFKTLPSEPQHYTVYQKDTTFGKSWYDLSFDVHDDAILLTMLNSSTISYKIFPVLREERLMIKMIIVPEDDHLIFYGLAAYRLGNTFGIDMNLKGSFDHRMSALQTWFSNQTY